MVDQLADNIIAKITKQLPLVIDYWKKIYNELYHTDMSGFFFGSC